MDNSSLLDELSNQSAWQEFFQHKKSKGYMSFEQEKFLADFIENSRYLPVAEKIMQQGFCFGKPQIKDVNKAGTGKKRIVYCFEPDQSLVLKLLASLLHKYDDYFCCNCFSFRKNLSVRQAIARLVEQIKDKNYCCYKLDISNYFNSINTDILIAKLSELFNDDIRLLQFFKDMLRWDGNTSHGAMAGTPTSPFLANVYLTDLDKHFFNANVPYARYSDDIIIFAADTEELQQHIGYIKQYLEDVGLSVNTKKEQIIDNGGAWQFLGIEYKNGDIDLSDVTINKIKGKIRRKARSICRWKNKKSVSDEKAVRVMINEFNKKFFYGIGEGELTWSRWYFQLLTVDKGLKQVDNYLQMWLRFIVAGKHNKTNYKKAPYEFLKKCGYISLVNRFYDKSVDITQQ